MSGSGTNSGRWFWGILLSILSLCLIFTGISFLLLVSSVLKTGSKNFEYVETGSGKQKIAIVDLDFTIIDAAPIVRQFKKYREDKSIKAIILRVNSPGGGVAASQEMYEEVRKTRQSGKPVIVSFGSIAASGGYYVACGSSLIVSNPGTLTGSIGVIISFANFKELAEKIGIKDVTFKSGNLKDSGNPLRDLNEDDKKYFQEIVDDSYGQFLEVVSRERKIDMETLKPLANGRVFTGKQAKELGLVDSLGTFEDAVRITTQIAGIEGEPVIVREKKTNHLIELFLENLTGSQIREMKEEFYSEYINKPVLQYKFER
jgi:protease IV